MVASLASFSLFFFCFVLPTPVFCFSANPLEKIATLDRNLRTVGYTDRLYTNGPYSYIQDVSCFFSREWLLHRLVVIHQLRLIPPHPRLPFPRGFATGVRVHVRVRPDDAAAVHQLQAEERGASPVAIPVLPQPEHRHRRPLRLCDSNAHDAPPGEQKTTTSYVGDTRFDGFPLCAGLVGTKKCAGLVPSGSTLHVGPDQPDPRSIPNPNPNPSPIPLGGSWSVGAVTRLRRVLGWRFPKKHPGGRKASLDR